MNQKVTFADLFSGIGGFHLSFKELGSEFEVLMVKEDKSFNLKEGFNVTSSSIKIQSSEKPELRDVLKVNDQEFIIKSSPRSLSNNIYELEAS